MTGEVTLTGRLLPVGGIKEKVLAAHRAGMSHVLLPDRNRKDLDEIPREVIQDLTFLFADSVLDALSILFPAKGIDKGHDSPVNEVGEASEDTTAAEAPPAGQCRAGRSVPGLRGAVALEGRWRIFSVRGRSLPMRKPQRPAAFAARSPSSFSPSAACTPKPRDRGCHLRRVLGVCVERSRDALPEPELRPVRDPAALQHPCRAGGEEGKPSRVSTCGGHRRVQHREQHQVIREAVVRPVLGQSPETVRGQPRPRHGFGWQGTFRIDRPGSGSFVAKGIPVVPVDDSNRWNPYQAAVITVKDGSGNVIVTTKATIPTSDEINCLKCHGSFSGIIATQTSPRCCARHATGARRLGHPRAGELGKVSLESHPWQTHHLERQLHRRATGP